MTRTQTAELVAQLDLDLDAVCHACLCVVSFALDNGDQRQVAGALRAMTPDLWQDGLDKQAFAAVQRACELDLPHAHEALADLEQHGAKGTVARQIVRRLATQLSAQVRTRREEAAMN